jgi:hypothetical protein
MSGAGPPGFPIPNGLECRHSLKQVTPIYHSMADFLIKACSKCKHFFDASGFHPDKRMRDGCAGECRSCRNQRALAWQQKNPQVKRNTHLKAKFGLDQSQFDSMLSSQNHRCAICMSTEPKGRGTFHVDHCHKTGEIRGLLCHDCNTGIGKLGDNVEGLRQALTYLERFEDG